MYIVFFLLWVIFNGQLTLEIALFGIVIAAVMYAFVCRFMDYSFRKDVVIVKEIGYILWYIVVLFWEIIKANMATIRFIMARTGKNEPVLIRFQTDLQTQTARALLANSITLTPGTITVSLEQNEYVVHCLDKSMAEGIEDSIFVKLLTKMEGMALKDLKKEGGKANG